MRWLSGACGVVKRGALAVRLYFVVSSVFVGSGNAEHRPHRTSWPEPREHCMHPRHRPRVEDFSLKSTGIQSIPDFAFAYNEVAELSRFCDAPAYAQLWQDLGIDEPEHSPAMARLRRAWHRCKALAQAAEAPVSSSEASSAPQLPLNSWAEYAPPRLDAATIAQLTKDFQTNYAGEHLDGDAMPSVRLLSIVHKWFSPGGSIAWIPWQLRLSQKQYQEIIESKTTKTLRTEAQFLSTALYDETPELPVDHLRLSPAWLGRIQTVFRNAIALCKGAHLARLKAFDEKVLDLATHSPADASLRTVTATELVSADRKLWQEIASLHSTGWSLDDALHEMTTVRADIGNLLQYRARPPPPPQKPPPRKETKGKDGKGGGKTKNSTQPGKRKEPGTGAASEVKTSDLVKEHAPFGARHTLMWARHRTVLLYCVSFWCPLFRILVATHRRPNTALHARAAGSLST